MTAKPIRSDVWNFGALLLRLGVDPELLGWREEDEDWVDVEDGGGS